MKEMVDSGSWQLESVPRLHAAHEVVLAAGQGSDLPRVEAPAAPPVALPEGAGPELVGALVLEAYPPRGIIRLLEKQHTLVRGRGGRSREAACGCVGEARQEAACWCLGLVCQCLARSSRSARSSRACLAHCALPFFLQGDRPLIERLVAEEYMLDTVFYFEPDRVECAKRLAGSERGARGSWCFTVRRGPCTTLHRSHSTDAG